MNNTFSTLEERNIAIGNEYFRLRDKKQLSQRNTLQALYDLGIFLTVDGRKRLSIMTLRCIVLNRLYLKKDREAVKGITNPRLSQKIAQKQITK